MMAMGLPLLTTFLDHYDMERAKLVVSECTASVGGELPLSDREAAADLVLRSSRAALDPLLPALSYFDIADTIAKSKLFRLLRPLPKGAALHVHFDSLMPASWFVSNATYEPDCHVCWPGAGGPTAFRFFSPGGRTPPGCASTKGWQPVAALRTAAADRAAFDGAIEASLSMRPANHTRGAPAYASVDAAWAAFMPRFGLVAGLLFYEVIFRRYVAAALESFAAEQVR